MFRTIKTKLLTAQVGLVLFVSVVVGLTTYFLMHYFLRKSQQQNLTFIAESVGKQLDLTIRNKEKMLEWIAMGETVSVYSEKYQEQLLLKYFGGYSSDFRELAYVNKDGREELKVINGRSQDNLSDISESVLYEEASWKPNKTVSFFYEGNADVDTARMEFAFYRRNFFDEFEGMVVGRISIREFFKSIQEFKFGKEGFAIVVDRSGFILAHPEKDKILKQMTTGDSKLTTFYENRAETKGFCRTKVFGVDSFIALSPIATRDWTVMAILPYQEFIVAPTTLRNISIFVSLVILIVSSLMSYLLASKISGPILELTNKARIVAQGDFSQQVDIKSNDEIGLLCGSFNSMIRNLNQSTTSIEYLNVANQQLQDSEQRLKAVNQQLEANEEKLRDNMNRLMQFNRLAVNRELQMAELKKEVNDLLGELGQERKYRTKEEIEMMLTEQEHSEQ